MDQTILSIFGENPQDPEALRELQKDMIYVREWRVTMETVQRRSFWGVLSFLGAGLAAAVYMGIQAAVRAWTQ